MDLTEQLHAGNTRVNRDRIARWVGTDPDRLAELMQLYLTGDRRTAQLAAGIVTIITDDRGAMLSKWVPKMVRRMQETDIHPAVRRAAVRAFQTIDIPSSQRGRVVDICFRYVSDISEPIAIRVFALVTLRRIAKDEPGLDREIRQTVAELLPYSTAAFRVHARRLFASEPSKPQR